MKILIIGLGSMGKRRLRLINKINSKLVIIGVDANVEKCKEAESQFNIDTFLSIDEAKEKNKDIDTVFVCTAPLSHSRIIYSCLTNGWNVFTELNLVSDGYEENIKLAHKNNCVLFLSSTFLYREEINYLSKELKGHKKLNYIYHIGQYLPDWHPWESYKNFFVGEKRTNGCREIMAIEFPWLLNIFGDIVGYNVLSDKMSSLDITYADNYMIQLQHENDNKGVLIVDIVSPKAVRKLEVYGESIYLSWDGTPESLRYFDDKSKKLCNVSSFEQAERMEGYSSFVVENAYKNEIEDFFSLIVNRKTQSYGFREDFRVLELIDKIEGIK